MYKRQVKKGDTVVVLSGKDKGKQGKVQGTIPSEAKVIVEGINTVSYTHLDVYKRQLGQKHY